MCKTNCHPDSSPQEIHPLKKIPHEEIRQKTLEKKQTLEAFGYELVQITECQWCKKRRDPEIATFIKNLKLIQPRHQLNSQKIIDSVKNGSLFGFVQVDIFTPEELKPKFRDLP